MKLIKKVIRLVLARLFIKESVILFKMDKPLPNSSPAVIKKATKDNVSDVLSFQEESYVAVFEGFLKSGDIGFFGYINGTCIHRSWVIINEGATYNPHPLSKKRLANNEVYIHYCETAPNARGQNVYPFVISEIAKEFSDKDVLICVNQKNTPSVKGVKKAGFKPIQLISINAVLGMVFKREQNLKGDEY